MAHIGNVFFQLERQCSAVSVLQYNLETILLLQLHAS